MQKVLFVTIGILLVLVACRGGMGDKPAATVGSVEIYRPMAMSGVAGQVTAAFMTIKNSGSEADRLMAASSEVAETVQVHESLVENNVMSMREVAAIDLPPGQIVELKHGSYHIMLINLRADLKAGQTFTLHLKFEQAGEVAVPVVVVAR